MRIHTNNYKNEIKKLGRQLDSLLTYTQNGETIELGMEELNSITPVFESNILKSAMRELDIDSNVEIPVGTIVNYQFGVKIRNEEVEDYRDNYDYIDFGNYIVKEVEKQEDLKSYKITCYDKMLYAMVDYDLPNVTYPITIRNYINAICQKLGITFANASGTFANYNRQINEDLYKDQGYTFRDVLDELAQVTASTICINENDQLEIRYITSTNDIINEEYLKNININFGEKYGPINSIVLSRSAESDNVYLKDDTSVAQNGLCEIKIIDNQIMNFNDRADYLPDILSRLGGLEYYLNDYSSPGVTYFDICDRYSVQIGEQIYSCVMFNDEINITQGLEENVYTEIPNESVTDYTKADKTDRKINQTYLIVDKQNQTIEGVVSRVDGQDEQIATIRLQYNELLSRISDIADITTSGESSYASVNLVDVNASQPIDIKIHPITEHVSYLYPYNGLYPSDILYPKSRTLRFTNTTTSEYFDWVLPTDLWYYDSTHYDELELSYGDGTNSTVTVTRKCTPNADGTISLLQTPTTETYSYPEWLVLTDGDYTAKLIDNNSGYLFVQLMAKNIYTTQFYTKAETNSIIDQTASSINLSVDTKLSNYSTTQEMNSAITLKANEITSTVSETYSTKTETQTAENNAKAYTDGELEDYSTTTQMNSAINQKANEITSTVSQTYATKTTTNSLSSRISQTAKSIALSVNNGSTSSGITITTTKEDGTTSTSSGTIQMTGLVKFTDLSTSGSTTINGANITTGTIKSSNYVSGTSGTSINLSTGAIDSKNFKLSSSGNITATGGTIGGWTLNNVGLNKTSGNYTFSIRTDRNNNEPCIEIWDNANSRSNFLVNASGYLYARNCEINGTVNASSGSFTGGVYSSYGSIGGWTISSSRLYGTSYGHQYAIAPYGVDDETESISAGWGQIIRVANQYSDKNLKKDIKELENNYDNFFNELKPITFKWKESKSDKTHIGFIAQDVQKAEQNNNLDLDIVYKNENNELLNLDKQEIIALNTWQIQKLKKQVEEQQKQIDKLMKLLERNDK